MELVALDVGGIEVGKGGYRAVGQSKFGVLRIADISRPHKFLGRNAIDLYSRGLYHPLTPLHFTRGSLCRGTQRPCI